MVWKALAFSLLLISLLQIFTTSSAQMILSTGSEKQVKLQAKTSENHSLLGSKMERGFQHGGTNGGGSTGTSENGNNGNPGTNFIPVYTAGAANNHHQNIHHGKGNCNLKTIGYPSLLVTSLFSLLNSFLLI